jgi:predicted secreted acid phosphatase
MTDCWIFDIDGTLANGSHRQHYLLSHPKNWDEWYANTKHDTLHEDIADFVKIAHDKGMKVILCTGRDDRCETATINWLFRYGIKYDHLFMRENKDFRLDSIIKKEMLDNIRLMGYNPLLVFEDRDSVVKMWRENGIRCLQVQEGNF